MDVKEAIQKRRAYRALGPVEITDEIITELASAAQLTASCFNNQPWRFVFVRSKEVLAKLHEGLNKGNDWVRNASMIIAAFAKKENDCIIKEREYYLFDLGMAVSAHAAKSHRTWSSSPSNSWIQSRCYQANAKYTWGQFVANYN